MSWNNCWEHPSPLDVAFRFDENTLFQLENLTMSEETDMPISIEGSTKSPIGTRDEFKTMGDWGYAFTFGEEVGMKLDTFTDAYGNVVPFIRISILYYEPLEEEM